MSESKKDIVKKVNDTFAAGSPDGFLEFCAEDFTWNMVGEPPIKGHDAVRKFMTASGAEMEPPKFTVDKMIEEGDSVVCYGDMSMKEKGVDTAYSYCDVYTFKGDQITELRAFVVKNKTADEGRTASA
jgi:ketosteroid isomerase-like protein